jgi:hypothetical protein
MGNSRSLLEFQQLENKPISRLSDPLSLLFVVVPVYKVLRIILRILAESTFDLVKVD